MHRHRCRLLRGSLGLLGWVCAEQVQTQGRALMCLGQVMMTHDDVMMPGSE